MSVKRMLRITCDQCGRHRESTEHDDPVDMCGDYGWEFFGDGEIVICAWCQDARDKKTAKPNKRKQKPRG